MQLSNNKSTFDEYVKNLQKHNTHMLYDTVLKQTVYTGTEKECNEVLHSSINADYHKHFVILERSMCNV